MDPQFATVTFVSEGDGTHAATFRVPISHETTIRQLAKDSMQRFVLSRRGRKQTPPIRVTEVRVGGCTPSCAELFSKDLVMQVVLVKEEVIFMKLQFASALLAETEPEVVAPVSKSFPPALLLSLENDKLHNCPGVGGLSELPGVAKTYATPEKVPSISTKEKQDSLAQVVPLFSSKRRARVEEVNRDDFLEAARGIQKLESTRLGWGPEASKNFPDNYVSSPQKLMRRRKATVPKPNTKQQDHHADKLNRAAASGSKAPIESLPPGWGPEAYKCFPSNYVSSPDRLAREIRNRKRREQEEFKQKKMTEQQGPSQSSKTQLNRSPKIVPVRVATARQLDFSEIDGCRDDQTDCRPTIGHKVNPILVGEAEGD